MKHYVVAVTLFVALIGGQNLVGQRSKRPSIIRVDLSKEKIGRESAKFLSVVGNWSIVDDGGKKVLAVDGRQWLRGQQPGGWPKKRAQSMARDTKNLSTT